MMDQPGLQILTIDSAPADDNDVTAAWERARFTARHGTTAEVHATHGRAWSLVERMEQSERRTLPFLRELSAAYSVALMRDGDIQRAVPVVDSGLADRPGDLALTYHRGDFARRMGDWDQAESLLTSCFKLRVASALRADDTPFRTVKPAFRLAQLQLARGKINDAWKQLDRALSFDDEHVPSRCLGVTALLAMGAGKEASALMAELMVAHPESQDVRLSAGALAWLQGDTRGAQRLWTTAIGQTDAGHRARCHLAVAELCAGRKSEAVRHLNHTADRCLETAAARLLVSVSTAEAYWRSTAFEPKYLIRALGCWLRELKIVGSKSLLLNFSKNAFAYRSQVPGIDRLLTPAKRSAPPASVRSLRSVEATKGPTVVRVL